MAAHFPTEPAGSGLKDAPTELSVGHRQSSFEHYFEVGLWSCRYAVLIAVLASAAVAIGMFYVATVDTVQHLKTINDYASAHLPAAQHEELRTQTISHVVEAIDAYLLATVMLIFAFGLYEIFISRLDIVRRGDRARVLMVRSLDDLKQRLGQVVLLILIVKFFEVALRMNLKTMSELLFLSLGILLVAGALLLSHISHKVSSEKRESR
jgi:uncharacterized membrane protein YqhA